jgi:hypothetical protein
VINVAIVKCLVFIFGKGIILFVTSAIINVAKKVVYSLYTFNRLINECDDNGSYLSQLSEAKTKDFLDTF